MISCLSREMRTNFLYLALTFIKVIFNADLVTQLWTCVFVYGFARVRGWVRARGKKGFARKVNKGLRGR